MTDPNTLGNSTWGRSTARENLFTPTEQNMRVSGRITKYTVKESVNSRLVMCMKVNGRIMRFMALDVLPRLMEISTLDSGFKAKDTATAFRHFLVKRSTMVSGRTI